MGFFNEKGVGLFMCILSVIAAIYFLISIEISEAQKLFGIALMLIIVTIFLLVIYFDYSIENTKKELYKELEKLKDMNNKK